MCVLYVVPTPIGNLEDMTLRGVRILKEVKLILAEDTRTSGVLLKHYGIQNKLTSYHQFNEHSVAETLIERIQEAGSAALITDAGTPGISDPGYLIINHCIEAGIRIETLPGASALLPALVNSGLPADKFVFEGFLPRKKGRKTRLDILSEETRTMIFYESPFRLQKTLEEFGKVFGENRKAAVCREISKFYEETQRGSLHDLTNVFKAKTVKGEIVLLVAGKEKSDK